MKINLSEYCFEKTVKSTGRIVISLVLILPVILFYHSLPFLTANPLGVLLFSDWHPAESIYGQRSFIFTTLTTSTAAAIIAFGISLSVALYLYFYRNKLIGRLLLKVIKIMSGIPTVVYGLAGIMIIVPIIRNHSASSSGLCLLSVIIILSILIVPTMTVYLLNGFNQVPPAMNVAGLSLGADSAQLFWYIILPQTKKSLSIALLLGFTRAMSDTMIALMVSGNSFRFPTSLFQSARNMTSQIALLIPGEFSGIEFKSIFFLALLLILIVIILDLLIIKMEKK